VVGPFVFLLFGYCNLYCIAIVKSLEIPKG